MVDLLNTLHLNCHIWLHDIMVISQIWQCKRSPVNGSFQPRPKCGWEHRMQLCLCVGYFKLVKLDESATHFDKIAAAAHQKFNTLAATVVESMVGRKVMAAIVMTSNLISVDSGCVVSLATGWYLSVSAIVV